MQTNKKLPEQTEKVSHSPGEWKAEGTAKSEIVIHSGGQQIAFMSVQNPDTEANAKLIAAAPELLEALQRFIAYADGQKAYQDQKAGVISEFESSMVLQAKSAIKKATS